MLKLPANAHFLLLLLLVQLLNSAQLYKSSELSPTEQALSLAAKLIKTSQVSAQETEQLRIKCSDDYVIDITTSELSVVSAVEQQQEVGLLPGPDALDLSKKSSGRCEPPEVSAQRRERVSALIRTGCHLRSSCSLNWTLPADYLPPANVTATDAEADVREHQQQQEACPRRQQRLLLEVVYKCRPTKLSKRVVCRDEQLKLECPSEKRLLIVTGAYGSYSDDKRNHERCKLSAAQQTPGRAYANLSSADYRDCQVMNGTSMQVLAENCLRQSRCNLDVNPNVFGEPNCPAGQVEYLKVIFTCVSASLLRPALPGDESAARGILASTATLSRATSGTSSASLLISTSAAPAATISYLSNSMQPNGTTLMQQQQQLVTVLPTSREVLAKREWSPLEKVRSLIYIYRIHVILTLACSALIIGVTFLIRHCGLRYKLQHKKQSSKLSSSSSSNHSSSNNNNNLTSKQTHLSSSQSESCYSLDDYNNTDGTTTNDSEKQLTKEDELAGICSGSGAYQTARPRLWTIHDREQADASIRAAQLVHQHNTLRAARCTFTGAPNQHQQLLQLPIQYLPESQTGGLILLANPDPQVGVGTHWNLIPGPQHQFIQQPAPPPQLPHQRSSYHDHTQLPQQTALPDNFSYCASHLPHQ